MKGKGDFMNQRHYDTLNEIKLIETFNNTGYMTVQMVADYFEVSLKVIDSVLKKRDIKGVNVYHRKQIHSLLGTNVNENWNTLRLIDEEGLIEIGLRLEHSNIANKFKKAITGFDKCKIFQSKELEFLDLLEEILEPFNIKGIRQYPVLGYRIDYYIPELNVAIEYDEDFHAHYSYEAHEGRQTKIEQELDCRFIRVSDNKTNNYNVGYVLKILMEVLN